MSDIRPSEKQELDAIEEITSLLVSTLILKQRYFLSKLIGYNERKDDKEYREAYERIYQKDFVGPQYICFVVFAEKNSNIEMSIHKAT